MIITCPTCATRYTLSDSAVGPQGRKVRCAKCGHMWWQTQTDDEPELSLDDVTEIRQTSSAFPSAKAARAPRKRKPVDRAALRRALVSWGLFLIVVAALAGGAYVARAPIVHLWPPAALLYETLGVPVEPPGTGLQIQNVRSEQKVENGATVLVVDGQIVNGSDAVRAVPMLRVTSLGQDRQPIRTWTVEASPAQLLPGEVAVFRDAQRDPGPVLEVMITFEGG